MPKYQANVIAALQTVVGNSFKITPEEVWEHWSDVSLDGQAGSVEDSPDRDWNWGRIKDLKFHAEDIPLDRLKDDRGGWRPTKAMYGDEEELAQQYAQEPVEDQPAIIVRKEGSTYYIIDGRHRSRASAIRGDDTVYAFVGVSSLKS